MNRTNSMLLVCLLLLTPGIPGAPDNLNPSPAQLEDILLFIVNQERSLQGLNRLQPHPGLRALAQRHSCKMAMEKSLSHDFPGYDPLEKRMMNSGLTFLKVAENVARCSDSSMRLVHQALMDSPGHRDNILDPSYQSIGLGVTLVGRDLYITQLFCKPFFPSSPLAVEERIGWQLQTRMGWSDRSSGRKPEKLTEVCRDIARRTIAGEDPQTLTSQYPNDLIAIVAFHEIDEPLLQRAASALSSVKSRKWGLGVAFGRNADFPGGVYHLVLYCVCP